MIGCRESWYANALMQGSGTRIHIPSSIASSSGASLCQSRAPTLRVPLNAMCSKRWARPASDVDARTYTHTHTCRLVLCTQTAC